MCFKITCKVSYVRCVHAEDMHFRAIEERMRKLGP